MRSFALLFLAVFTVVTQVHADTKSYNREHELKNLQVIRDLHSGSDSTKAGISDTPAESWRKVCDYIESKGYLCPIEPESFWYLFLELFDTDRDGELSVEEVMRALREMGFGPIQRLLARQCLEGPIDWEWFKIILHDLCEHVSDPRDVPLCYFVPVVDNPSVPEVKPIPEPDMPTEPWDEQPMCNPEGWGTKI